MSLKSRKVTFCQLIGSPLLERGPKSPTCDFAYKLKRRGFLDILSNLLLLPEKCTSELTLNGEIIFESQKLASRRGKVVFGRFKPF